jgi:hypothetical protein
MAEPRSGPLVESRLDSPPPLPPRLSDRNAPDLAKMAGQPTGTPPSGGLAEVVVEHGMLAENVLVSLAKILPALTPLISQITASLRTGIVGALQNAGTPAGAQQSLAAGAGPVPPPPPPIPPQGGPGAAGPVGGPVPAAAPQPGGAGPAPPQ